MSRSLFTVPLLLAIPALTLFVSGCGSSSPTKVRFVHAIQDAGPLDIAVSNADVKSTLEFTDISFLGVQPNQPGYTSIPSGGDTIQGLATGTSTVVFSDTLTLGSDSAYTLVASGFSQTGTNGSNVDLLLISDSTPTPASGNVVFRVINASPSGPNGLAGPVDVYVLLNPASAPAGTPTFSGIDYTQGSTYVSIPNNPNDDPNPPGFTVFVTPTGVTTPVVVAEPVNPIAGAVRTLVLTDVQDGTKMSDTFLELSDLN
jgi:hypothetical protein